MNPNFEAPTAAHEDEGNKVSVERTDVHLDEDSSLKYKLIELKDLLTRGEGQLEDHFETREANELERGMAVAHYESMLNEPKACIGLGNTALVFRQRPDVEQSERCVKCRWDFLMVNNKSKKDGNLPENLQRLKKVERYFAEVAEKRRSLIASGYDFLADNSTLREAVIQHMAARALAESGKEGIVPDIDFIIEIERAESGDAAGDPFMASETVDLMFMEQVPGSNLQDLIYEGSPAIAAQIDVDAIERELRSAVEVLHEWGIAHRDLSLRNIMLHAETLMPRIIDFGKSSSSEQLSDADRERDLSFLKEAVRFLRKFKANPAAASAELRDMHKD